MPARVMSRLQVCTGSFCTLAIISCFITYVVSRHPACREAFFQILHTGEPLEDEISSHHVNSWLECGGICLENDDCVTFSHSETSRYEMNCKITNQLGEFAVNNAQDVDSWTTYKRTETELEICLTQQPCKNGGTCVRNSCEPDGYECTCSEWYTGKYCENENSNFDVVFLSQDPVPSYIEMDSIKSNLKQFTFTAWFKFTVGTKKFYLLSYKQNNQINLINLGFLAHSYTVLHFEGHILQQGESSYMIPVNDNVWHHCAFVWDNKNGRWDVLIDGTLRAMRDSVKTGLTIAGGGTLVMGQRYSSSGFVSGSGLLGHISGVNIWDKALSGQELDVMAKSRGNEQGNVLRWFEVLGNLAGDVQVVKPSNAHSTNKDLDFELEFRSNSSSVGYILSPGPKTTFDQLSICLWLKTTVTSTFVSYDTDGQTGSAFTFGITKSYHLFAKINGVLVKSPVPDSRIVNNYWHFICLEWNGLSGKVRFYYEGPEQSAISTVTSQLSQGGKFSVGVTKDQNSGAYVASFVGTLSCLNIWSVLHSEYSVVAMSSGSMNINGDYLAWRDVTARIVGNIIVHSKTVIYYPGYSLLAKRSKWCNDHVTSLSCPILYARLGQDHTGKRMAWRCYCGDALYLSKYAYIFKGKKTSYATKHEELLTIN